MSKVNISKTQLNIFKEIFFVPHEQKPLFSPSHTKNAIIKFMLEKLIKNENVFTFNELSFTYKNKPIPLQESAFFKQNRRVLTDDGRVKPEVWQIIQKRFYELNKRMNNPISSINNIDNEDNEEKVNKMHKISDTTYKLEKYHTIIDIFDAFSESRGDCDFSYDFSSSTPTEPDSNLKTVQHWKIVIQSPINFYNMYVRYHYHCMNCGASIWKSYNDVVSTKGVIYCDNIIEGSNGKLKKCNTRLSEPTQLSDTITIYRYDATYQTKDGKKVNILVESIYQLENFEYECAGVVLNDNGTPYLFILDYIPIKKHRLTFDKTLLPRKKTAPNIIPKLIDYIDNKIYELSGDRILGMYDIKFHFLIQKLSQVLGFKRIWNIALSGKNDTGKTYIIDRYGTFLFGGYYKKSFGQTISLPALRGSAKSNREVKRGNKNRVGLLNIFDCIYIDEIFENPELMEQLKPILLEDTYSNDKADGDRVEYEKRALLCIAENPDREHLALYEGMIKKLYNEYLMVKVNKDNIIEWDNSWDLFQPLYTYTNPLLRNTINEVRLKFYNQDKHWIDGRSLAIHDRFPLYLSLERDGSNTKIIERANSAIESELISKDNIIELKKKLATENIDDFFKRYIKFKECKFTPELQKKLIDIIVQYGFEPRSRLAKFCARVLNCSRILNQRYEFSEVDFDYVRRYLYLRDRRVKISELEEREPVAPIPDLSVLELQPGENSNDDMKFDFDANEFGDIGM